MTRSVRASACQGRVALLLAALIAAAMVSHASAHGYLLKPAPRNVLATGRFGFYGPMSLNRYGKTGCGGYTNTDSRFAAGGMFAANRITASYKSGGIIHVQSQVWNNHWGWIDVRLCPLSNPTSRAERNELTEKCFNAHKLTQTNGSGTRHWINRGLRSARFTESAFYRLPKGVKCKRCVLQWRWITGHMCTPPGRYSSFRTDGMQGLHTCPANYMNPYSLRPEKFYNCADIRIS